MKLFKIFLLSLLVLIGLSKSFAVSNNGKIGAYKMVIEYLAIVQQDKNMPKKYDKDKLVHCTDLDCIKDIGNNITGLNELIRKAESIAIEKEFKEFVINEICSGNDTVKVNGKKVTKNRRSEQFNKETELFKQKINELDIGSSSAVLKGDGAVGVVLSSPKATIDSAIISNIIIDTIKKSYQIPFYIIALIALASLLLSLFLFKKLSKMTSERKYPLEITDQNSTDKSFAQQIQDLRIEYDKKLHDILSYINELNIQITLLQSQNSKNSVTPNNLNIKDTKVNQQVESENIKSISVKYAKNSFKGFFYEDSMYQNASKECIFELHISDNTAVIKISNNPETQKYALSFNPKEYFTDDICNVKSGELSLAKSVSLEENGEGKAILTSDKSRWEITKKIDLNFK